MGGQGLEKEKGEDISKIEIKFQESYNRLTVELKDLIYPVFASGWETATKDIEKQESVYQDAIDEITEQRNSWAAGHHMDAESKKTMLRMENKDLREILGRLS